MCDHSAAYDHNRTSNDIDIPQSLAQEESECIGESILGECADVTSENGKSSR